MFIDDDGTFLAPNEVEDNFNAIFEFRQEAGANDNEDTAQMVIRGVPPLPILENPTACGEAGLAILDEITGDLFDLIGLESVNRFLMEVRNQLADLIDAQRTDIGN